MATEPVVLLLEDMPNWQKVIGDILEAEGYDVVKASSLSEGKMILDSRIVDIAIVDIRLEEGDVQNIDGVHFLDELEKKFPSDHTHAIMLSGHADKEVAVNALTRPFQMVLNFFFKEKLDEEKLIKEVARAVRATRIERGDSQERLIKPYLPKSFIELLEISDLVANFSTQEKTTKYSRDLVKVLEILLFPQLPLAKTEKVKKRIFQTNQKKFIHFICWSRKNTLAMEVCVGNKNSLDLAKPRLLVEIDEKYKKINEISTMHFDGVVFGFPEIKFKSFLDFLND